MYTTGNREENDRIHDQTSKQLILSQIYQGIWAQTKGILYRVCENLQEAIFRIIQDRSMCKLQTTKQGFYPSTCVYMFVTQKILHKYFHLMHRTLAFPIKVLTSKPGPSNLSNNVKK